MRFKGLDLNLVPVLNLLLEHRSTVRVADELNISQPAISASLNRLREYFQDPLLIVEGRKMVPTTFAMQLRPHVLSFLSGADTLVSTSSVFDPAKSSRSFRICTSDYLILVLFQPLLLRLAKDAPFLSFELSSPTEEITQQMERGELDLLISPIEYLSSENPSLVVFEDSFVVVGWAENPIFAQPIDRETFCNAGHVAVRLGKGSRTSAAESHLRSLAIERRVEVLASSFGLVPELLVGTERVGIMHRRLAEKMSSRHPLAIQTLPFDFPPLIEGLQFHRTRSKDAGLQWLIHQICRAPD